MGSAGKVREAVRIKQYRRVCEGCGETFRPYKDVFTCADCETTKYSIFFSKTLSIPRHHDKRVAIAELMEDVWF